MCNYGCSYYLDASWVIRLLMVQTIDNRILNFLDVILRAIAIDKKITNFTDRKNGGHFKRRTAIGQRNTPHHSYTSGSKEVPACIRNIVLMHDFRQYFVCLHEKIFNCCNVKLKLKFTIK